MVSFRSELRIHAWGGLGSQLFAVEAASRLRKRFPRKAIHIILHSAGVTKRLPEVLSLYPDYSFICVDDFMGGFSLSTQTKSKQVMRSMMRVTLLKLGFVSNSNSDFEFFQIKPWCLSLRGHYSYRTIDDEFLKDLYFRMLRNSAKTILERKDMTIHYRLGDLLNLQEKSFISPERIEAVSLDYGSQNRNITIYSDSPNVAFEKLQSLNRQNSLSVQSLPVIETMIHCVNSNYFIGTSSKISFWIAGMRSQCFALSSKLPIENQREFKGLINRFSVIETSYS